MQVVGGGFADGGETTPDNAADCTIPITRRETIRVRCFQRQNAAGAPSGVTVALNTKRYIIARQSLGA